MVEILMAFGGLVSSPVSWAVAFFIVVLLLVFRGHLIPREQVKALTDQSDKVEKNLERNIELIRADRDRSIDLLSAEKDAWRKAAEESQEVAQSVRQQNTSLISRLEALDHLLSELRKATGLPNGGDSSG